MGRMVSVKYMTKIMARRAPAIFVTMELTGCRNATRPAKNRTRDVCRSKGISSTTECMLNLLIP
jgi:hypothetical protein